MSRDIKFRAWSDETMTHMPRMFLGVGQIGFSDDHYVDLGLHDQEKADVMQYTGLKDKNGVELYEGDVVKIEDDWADPTTHQVKWGDDYPAFELYPGFDLESNNLMSALAGEGGMTVEVIGNIYENPELLEGGKDE